MTTDRVTITLPTEVIREIDEISTNRSRFILRAVRNELERQRREELRQSISNPHEESARMAELGIKDWGAGLPDESNLVDADSGRELRWRTGEGWSTSHE